MVKNMPLKFQFQDQIMILTLVSHGHAIRGSFTNYVYKRYSTNIDKKSTFIRKKMSAEGLRW